MGFPGKINKTRIWVLVICLGGNFRKTQRGSRREGQGRDSNWERGDFHTCYHGGRPGPSLGTLGEEKGHMAVHTSHPRPRRGILAVPTSSQALLFED